MCARAHTHQILACNGDSVPLVSDEKIELQLRVGLGLGVHVLHPGLLFL